MMARPAMTPTTTPAIQALLECDSGGLGLEVLVWEALVLVWEALGLVWEGVGKLVRGSDWVVDSVESTDEPRNCRQKLDQLWSRPGSGEDTCTRAGGGRNR